MNAKTSPSEIGYGPPPAITVWALNENKRPIGFAAWSTEDEKPKRKPRPRRKKAAE